MNQFGAENLKALTQFFDVMLEILLYGGSFMKPVTDVDVHDRLGIALQSARNQVLSKANCTPARKNASGEIDELSDQENRIPKKKSGGPGSLRIDHHRDLRYHPGP
jgi:hypothetical protein